MQGLWENVNLNTALAGLFVLIMVYVLARALVIPAKFALRVGMIAVSGMLLLLISNVALQAVDVFLPINPFTVLLTGYLGPPGLLALYLIQFFLAF